MTAPSPRPKRRRIIQVLFPLGCWWHDRVRLAKETGDTKFLRLERRLMVLAMVVALGAFAALVRTVATGR
jgi:hypothetical protein